MLKLQQLLRLSGRKNYHCARSLYKILTCHLWMNSGEKLTLGFAEVQGMVRHRYAESLSRIDVSSRVVVTLGGFYISAFLCRCCEEEEESGAERTEKLLLYISVQEKLHCIVPLRAPNYCLAMAMCFSL